MTHAFSARGTGLAVWLGALLVLALLPARSHAADTTAKDGKALGGCFNPFIEPRDSVVSANVGDVVQFAGEDNLDSCFCGGDVKVEMTTQNLLTPFKGATFSIAPTNSPREKVLNVNILSVGPQDIRFNICLQASRLATSQCGSWTSETYCEPRAIHVNQVRAQGDLSVSPGEVEIPPGQRGSVTLDWWTTKAKSAEIYVQSGGPRTLVSSELNGSLTYSQLEPYKTYTFELYVNGIQVTQHSVKTSAAVIHSATLTATPTTLVLPANTSGTTTLEWSTQNVSSARLDVRVNGGPPQNVASGTRGRVQAAWIQAGSTYVFTIQETLALANQPPLASVTVRGVFPPLTPPARGHWYNPGRPGNGLDLQPSVSNTVSLTWFTYTPGGAPTWYMSNLQAGPEAWAGDLLEYSWEGSSASPRVVGTASLVGGQGQWRYKWTLGASSGEEPIVPLEFGGGASVMDLNGNWYDAQHPGWGTLFTSRGTTHLAMLPIYAGGHPTWLQGVVDTSATSFAMPLNYVTGTNLCPGCTGTTSVAVQPVGTLSIQGAGGAPGTLRASIQANFPTGSWNLSALTLSRLTGP